MDSHKKGRYYAEMEKWLEEMKKDEKDKMEEMHQHKGVANVQECGGKCRSLAQNFKTHSMVERCADLGK